MDKRDLHDINNKMTIIQGTIEITIDALNKHIRHLNELLKNCDIINNIVKREYKEIGKNEKT